MKAHRLFSFLTVACVLVACTPQPSPVTPPQPDADAMPPPPLPPLEAGATCAFQASPCGDACKVLAGFGCPNSAELTGSCCSDWLCDEPAYALGELDANKVPKVFACIVKSKTKAAVAKCGVLCP